MLTDKLKVNSAMPIMFAHQGLCNSLVHRPQVSAFTSTSSGKRAEMEAEPGAQELESRAPGSLVGQEEGDTRGGRGTPPVKLKLSCLPTD